jgi:hypothetical protein
MKDEDRNDPLVAAASGLATEIGPERDLWPGIAGRIANPPRRWPRFVAQAAAVVLLIGASSGITLLVTGDEPAAPTGTIGSLNLQPVSFMPGPGYQEARDDVTAQLDEELARMTPATRDVVETNLAVLRGAIAEINAALATDPTSPLLQELLLRAYQDEMEIMYRVGDLTRQVMAREDI